jgi:Recombinase
VRDLRRHDVKLPSRDGNGQLAWRLATVTIVSTALHHPLYAGAYSWGRRQTQTHIDVTGRVTQSRRQRAPAEWAVLLHDRVPAYITWDQYLANPGCATSGRQTAISAGIPTYRLLSLHYKTRSSLNR